MSSQRVICLTEQHSESAENSCNREGYRFFFSGGEEGQRRSPRHPHQSWLGFAVVFGLWSGPLCQPQYRVSGPRRYLLQH